MTLGTRDAPTWAMIDGQLEQVLARFEGRADAFSESELVTATLREYRSEPKLPDEVLVEVLPFWFRPSRSGVSVWGTYYGPEITVTDQDGNVIRATPDIRLVTAAMISHWVARLSEAKHPVLRARYADVAWDIGKKVDGARVEVDCARAAVRAAVEVASLHLGKREIRVADQLARALSVAISLRDSEGVTLA